MNVSVPAEAKVFVNGLATTSTGAQRRYVSNGLDQGFSYTYELRVELERNGQLVTETKTVKVKAGDVTEVKFDLNNDSEKVAADKAATKLTLNVPANAKVTLAGTATQSTGEVREFTTTKLAAGQSWDNYVVRVELEQNGQTLVEERNLSLVGGENRELTVDFNVAKVASK